MRNSQLAIHYQTPDRDLSWDPRIHTTGLFKVTHTNRNGIDDFTGYIRAWSVSQEPVHDKTAPMRFALRAEVSWPASRDYQNRYKETYEQSILFPGTLDQTVEALGHIPCNSVWGIEGITPTLYYYTLTDEGPVFIGKEGALLNIPTGTIDALTCGPNGGIYFIHHGYFDSKTMLYLIPRSAIDANPDTDIQAIKIGPTDLRGTELAGIQFIDNKLWGISRSSGKVYSINILTGICAFTSYLSDTTLTVGGFTNGADGHIYLVAGAETGNSIFRFDSFPKGGLIQISTLSSKAPITCIASHPDGYLYLYNGTTCLKFDPDTGRGTEVVRFISSITDMSFFYDHEEIFCYRPIPSRQTGRLEGQFNLNPQQTSNFDFMMEVPGRRISRNDLLNDSSLTYEGAATTVRFCAQGYGRQSLMLSEREIHVSNKRSYEIFSESGEFMVRLFSVDSSASALPLWYVEFLGRPVTLSWSDQREPMNIRDRNNFLKQNIER